MNKFIQAIKEVNKDTVEDILQREPQWINWAESDGKNALHYLCGVDISKFPQKAADSLQILRLLLESGMNYNSVHQIKDGSGFFPATPLWYAYTRGRNKPVYTWLLNNGVDPEHCMYAIAWYDDAEAAALFKSHGAEIDNGSIGDTPFLAAFNWKRYKAAEWFLQNGADINFRDKKGNTALFYAVKRKLDTEPIRLLLRYGADIEIENNEGISPQKLAETNHQKKILNLFAQS